MLSRDSRNLTTFATHVGVRRYKRLNFGVNAAPEIFQNEIRQVLEGLTGTLNISDDIIIMEKLVQNMIGIWRLFLKDCRRET